MHTKQDKTNKPEEAKNAETTLKKSTMKPAALDLPRISKRFRKSPKSVIDSTPQIRVFDDPGSQGSSSASDNGSMVSEAPITL